MERALTEAEILEETQRAAREGRVPFEGRPSRGRGRQRPAAASPDAFTVDDLACAELNEGTPYPVPGTRKQLWVFGINQRDMELLTQWAIESLRGGAAEAARPGTDPALQQALQQTSYQFAVQVFQVILCCRTGPTRSAPRCFERKDFGAVRLALGYKVIEEICQLSNDRSGNEEALGPGVRRFFGLILKHWPTCASGCGTSESCPSGSAGTRTRLGSLVSRALSAGRLDAGMLSELVELGETASA